MKTRMLLPIAALVIAGPAAAQMQQGPTVNSIRPLYGMVKDWVVKGAEKMPEANFAWQPTKEIRTFGQLVGHIANANFMFCSGALGEASPSKTDYEKVTSKTELVAGLKAAIAYCDRAYQMADAQAMEMTKVFGEDQTRLYALNFNVAHDFEHYGNMVTYLRLKGIVPPSSAG
jgi:uncharacterized damage-inducible protein DinB